ncbi:MAG: FG-GAP-like repeat-containing protein [Janthinobacterium lividum]
MLHSYYRYLSVSPRRGASVLVAGAALATHLAAAQAPTLLSLSPRRNAPAAPRSGPVQLTFSAALDPATVGTIKVIGAQRRGNRALTASVSAGVVTLTLPAGTPFVAGEPVAVSVPATVRGAAGQAVRPQIYQFTAAVNGPGRGTFTTGTDVASGLGASGQQLADIDNDGDLDLLLLPPTVNYTVASAILVRLNDGRGNFSAGPTVSVGGPPTDTVLADLDGDGDLDLLASCYAGTAATRLSVRLNDGRGNFGAGSETLGLLAGGHLLATADLDGDGDLDAVLSTNTAGQTVASVRLNQGNGTFAGGSELAIAGGTGAFTLGDIDGDGDADYLTTGFSTGNIYTCLNQGNGSFGAPTSYSVGNNPASLALADLDGDGDLDLLAGCARTNTVETRLNDGQGQFAASGAAVPVGDYPQYMRLADLDSDGDQDLLTGNLYGGNVSVRFNRGGTFGSGADVALGKYTFGLVVGDVDGDNDVDFLVNATPSAGDAGLRVGFNQGPTCAAADTTATLSPAGGVALGCGQAPATLSVAPAPTGATYEWQYAPAAGAAWQTLPAASLPTYQPSQPGRYRVRVGQGGCVAVSAATEARAVASQLYDVPNIFTPNNDGINDQFELRLAAPRTSEVRIFSRWGREVFSSDAYAGFWTGAGCAAGIYYYLWRYTTDCDPAGRTVRGTVELVR